MNLVMGSCVKSMIMRLFIYLFIYFGQIVLKKILFWWKVINKERDNTSINQVIMWKIIAFNGVFLTVGSLTNQWCKKGVSL